MTGMIETNSRPLPVLQVFGHVVFPKLKSLKVSTVTLTSLKGFRAGWEESSYFEWRKLT